MANGERNKNEAPAQKISREVSPVIEPLIQSPERMQRFAQIVNAVLETCGAQPIQEPRYQMVKNVQEPYTCLTIPYASLDPNQIQSIKNMLTQTTQNQRALEGTFFGQQDKKGPKAMVHKLRNPQAVHFVIATKQDRISGNPLTSEGIFYQGPREKALKGTFKIRRMVRQDQIPQSGTIEIRTIASSQFSELELAYLTTMVCLISEAKLDVSTDDKFQQSLAQRQRVIWEIYQRMLDDTTLPVERGSIFGLDEQLADIDTNLYQPLLDKTGHPMNIIAVGAAGVGKSIAGQYFARREGVITVQTPVQLVTNPGQFESYILPKLLRLKNASGLPIVILVDDAEAIFVDHIDSALGLNPLGVIVDANKRSRALNLLETVSTKYGIYFLCNLNYPQIEAAFLRRFYPVYFPLPSHQDTIKFLRAKIPTGPLTEEEHDELIGDFFGYAAGLSYSTIVRARELLDNELQKNKGISADKDAYRTAVLRAGVKSRKTTDVKGIRTQDEGAKSIVSQAIREPLGFNTELVARADSDNDGLSN